MMQKPALYNILSKCELLDFYWLKSELIDFCVLHGLPTSGAKEALIERIGSFLETGKVTKPAPVTASKKRDSDNPIKRDTLVRHYKNDAKTRDFFIEQIGSYFRFNQYLRQFTNPENITENLTYGGLADGWLAEETIRQASHTAIGKQFEYNQFIRDFFANETDKTLQDAITAWKAVTAIKGENTYHVFKTLSKSSKP